MANWITSFSPSLAVPLFLPALTGFLFILLLIRNAAIRYKLFFLISFSIPVGFGISSLVVFWSYELGGFHAKQISFIVVAAICFTLFVFATVHGYLAQREIKIKAPPPPSTGMLKPAMGVLLTFLILALFLFQSTRFLEFYFERLTWNPLGGWDARYVWNLKARFFVRSVEHWRDMFSPLISGWSLRDYPLMLPASLAWGWNLLGREVLIWPGLINLCFFFSIVLLAIWYIASIAKWWYALIAGSFLLLSPSFQTWTTALYADVPLSFLFCGAGICLLQTIRLRSGGLAGLTGFLSGLSMWMKNEGIFFILWVGFIFMVSLTFSGIDRAQRKKLLLHFLAGLVIPVFTTCYLKKVYGGSGIYLQNSRSLKDYINLITNFERIQYIAASFAVFKINFELWRGLWFTFYTALVFYFISRFRSFHSNGFGWILALLVVFINLGYFFVFLITPLELHSHIQWALTRLLVHSTPLAILFIFESFWQISPPHTSKKLV